MAIIIHTYFKRAIASDVFIQAAINYSTTTGYLFRFLSPCFSNEKKKKKKNLLYIHKM